MSRVIRFSISGLAGRSETLKRDLNAGVNIFWGKNGCGKTSMLKILHSALQNDASLLARVPFSQASVQIETYTGVIERRINNISNQDPRTEEETLFTDDEWHELQARERLLHTANRLRWTDRRIKGEPSNRPVKHSYLSTLRLSDAPRIRQQGLAPSEVLDEAAYDRIFARQIRAIWQDYYTRELVQIRQAQQRGLAAIATSVMVRSGLTKQNRAKSPEIDAKIAYKAVEQFFAAQQFDLGVSYDEFIKNFQNSDLMREVVEEVVDVQRGIEAAQEPTAALQDLVSELFSGNKDLHFEGRNIKITQGDIDIPLQSLSSGEKQVIRLLIECLAAGANPVLIDEPELSMHVDWQHRLVNCMRTLNPGAQFILATHSPEIMADVADEEIMEL
ncbi:AAA family ATPase [Streptomyces sp. NPDC091217]|uniref:AAA family ATPase n=1 Tax=Streptomyces sp. NPDC091217 TaxID=3365975 RepID=UPI0038274068